MMSKEEGWERGDRLKRKRWEGRRKKEKEREKDKRTENQGRVREMDDKKEWEGQKTID